MSRLFVLLLVSVCAFSAFGQSAGAEITEGSLFAYGKDGKELGACPLKNTVVKTEISGFLARVRVKQVFENSFATPIEAVYTFPLSQNGAVDDMTMNVGSRVIRAKIMKREEARQVYETAKAEGKTASLLDQERPNIFTQSVANIMPGERVTIEISYVETLKYEDGAYEFVFPMTVGPRYIPGSVKDASKIKPPYAETRNGSDIAIEVDLNAGVPVEEVRSTSHGIAQLNLSPSTAKVTLQNGTTIPNKDFILRYDVTGGRIQDALLTHRDGRGGFFTLILQPPDKIANEDRTPKEIVFVLDTSGSMYGFPIEKAKEAMKLSLDGLYPDDTFNLITFAGDTHILFDGPVPATQANLERAKAFLDTREGGGGTEMMKAIKAALDPSDSKEHLRIVCFMTDGYVGNEEEIIAEVQRHPKARVFSFGIGSSVNRYLLDKMAEAGRGEAEYVALTDDGSKAAKKFYERVRSPLLTDLSIDWNGMPVADVYPGRLTDLFSAKPVILNGRFTRAANGTIKLRGKVAGQPYEREIAVNLPEAEAANDSLASLWARTRIDELSSEKLRAANPSKVAEYEKEIANLGLEFRLMTNFTSFVAVEDRVVNRNGQLVTVQVPVEVPEGVDPVMSGAVSGAQEVVIVTGGVQASVNAVTKSGTARKVRRSAKNSGGGGGGTGSGSGSGSGYGSGIASTTATATSGGTANAATAVVEVTSSTPMVDASQTSVTKTITQPQFNGLPLMSSISPGVAKMTRTDGPKGSVRLQSNGASGAENVFVIDGAEVTNFRTGAVNGPVRLDGRAVAVAEPIYPAEAKAVNALGEVLVEITIDREGLVVEAKAVSGHESLRKPAESAAMLSKFEQAFTNGIAVRVRGTIRYDFKSADKVEVFLQNMKAEPLSDEEKRMIALGEKLHFWLYDLAMRLQKGVGPPSANESKFVRDGRASVQVRLSAPGGEGALEKLRAAGLEITARKDLTVTGRVSLEKLASLAGLAEVSFILPKLE